MPSCTGGLSDENDNLAIASQIAIFFTLFAGLLKKMQVDELDNYDRATFGFLLIFVNCVGIGMVFLGALVKPMSRGFTKLGAKHIRDKILKGVGEEHEEWGAFEAYFRELAKSGGGEAAWLSMGSKDWNGKSKGGVRGWL